MPPPKPKLKPAWRRLKANIWPALAAILVACVLAFAVFGNWRSAVVALYAGASAISFFAYGIDKSAAMRQRSRTRERTLHVLALVGGWPGALLAQRVFRHKSSKPSFQALFWVTVVANCGLLVWGLRLAGKV